MFDKKILLIGLYYFENLGDPLYMLTTKKLIEQNCNAKVEIADIYGYKKMPKPKNIINKIINKIRFIFKYKILKCKRLELSEQYQKQFKGFDAVVVPGGGLISFSKNYPFHERIMAMQDACRLENIKFCMNAVGICKDANDNLKHTEEWKSIIDNSCMNYFSCRDGKDILQNICKSKIKQVSCTAVLSGDLFNIRKNENSNTIGIGIIRGNAFSQYGYDFSEEQLIDFYSALTLKIQSLGFKVCLFTNGLMSDYDIAKKIKNHLSDNIVLLDRPKIPEELVRQISGFKAIVCARMHAAIIAHSLDIPTVLFCWGVKGIEFMRQAGADEFALTYDKMNADYVVEKMCKAINIGWDKEKRESIRNSAKNSIKELLNVIYDSPNKEVKNGNI